MKTHDRGLLFRIINAAFVVLLLFGLAGCGKNYSRDEFTQLTMNKTEAEVRSVIGDPALIGDKPKTWTYYHKTYNAANQNNGSRPGDAEVRKGCY